MEDGRRRKASTTRNDGRTTPRLSLRVAPAVEATGEDPRSAESAVDPSQADRPVVVWDFDVCLSDDLAAGSQQRDEPAAVLGEPAVAVSRAGELAASGYAGPPAGEDRGEPDPGEPDRPDPTTHPQQEILSLFDCALYPLAIDGTQKLQRNWPWSEQCLERQVQTKQEDGTAEPHPQYYVYVLEAKLAFANGITIPLLSEFLDYGEGDQQRSKQDCELNAFYRLAQRVKEYFPRLPVLVLLDGLYANGPVLELCRHYHWQFMTVLQDDSLPSVWEEFRGLEQLERQNHLERNWGNRRQRFRWVNGIEYRYGEQGRKKLFLHVVVCEESWEEIDANSPAVVSRTARHAWISSVPLNRDNVHERCNLGARHRWAIEEGILVEKHQGYQYEHNFSYNWEAMRGYHFLMQIAHLLNALVQNSARLVRLVRSRGLRGLRQFLRTTCSGPWLDAERIRQLLLSPCQIRLE